MSLAKIVKRLALAGVSAGTTLVIAACYGAYQARHMSRADSPGRNVTTRAGQPGQRRAGRPMKMAVPPSQENEPGADDCPCGAEPARSGDDAARDTGGAATPERPARCDCPAIAE
jgi:hypothetical protein